MTARLIDGKKIASEIRAEVAVSAARLAERGTKPGLAAVLVGDDPASQVYVRMKKRACEEAGIYAPDMHLPADTTQEALIERIEQLNGDPRIHGILVQLPLPRPLDESEIMLRVRPEKDVDGFHPVNVGRMVSGDPDAFRPATPAGIQELLKRIDVDPQGRHVVVMGRSNIVGRPVAEILSQKQPWANATVTLAHSRTPDLGEVGRLGDILIVAIGRPEFVTADMVRPGAVVIDVGVNRVDDPETEKGYRLVGDVAFEAVRTVASWITPVPGGVGPMTIAMLLRNTIKAAERFPA
ncbi:MAG: bifunctional methylenetetrahydrofolate dehydrogenase/methenyltetrahydrofolate cyclohydrolase FolD [Gemmatimonadota bacterium]|jgi:methylenetetrahydrofolate dehydrogenase (NADP+)/methenyltetrahydrofolate cyclohydrolase|nr:MAG: bifunctional methylenetetrahydrofolate dehydrogenase/methenyltetrahydrofolate cyclohydrolase FolD [Gemmatimonadota bacterium]